MVGKAWWAAGAKAPSQVPFLIRQHRADRKRMELSDLRDTCSDPLFPVRTHSEVPLPHLIWGPSIKTNELWDHSMKAGNSAE